MDQMVIANFTTSDHLLKNNWFYKNKLQNRKKKFIYKLEFRLSVHPCVPLSSLPPIHQRTVEDSKVQEMREESGWKRSVEVGSNSRSCISFLCGSPCLDMMNWRNTTCDNLIRRILNIFQVDLMFSHHIILWFTVYVIKQSDAQQLLSILHFW